MFGKKSGKWRRHLLGAIVGGLLIPLAYIWFAGYDCEAPDDSDLAVREEVNWGPEQEKEFAAFTNVLAFAKDVDLAACSSDDDIKNEESMRILATNEWVSATFDHIAESDTFCFPPIEIYLDRIHSVDVVGWLYGARIKLAVEKGEFEKVLELLDRDLRVAEHYLLRGRTFVDYLFGIVISRITIDELRDLVQRYALPDSVLRRADERVRSAKGLDCDALFRAYRNAYTWMTHYNMLEVREELRRSFGVASFLFVRYLCQPNRTKAYLCAQLRKEMEMFRTGCCVRPDDKWIHSCHRMPSWHKFIDREWLGKEMTVGLTVYNHDVHKTIAAGLALRAQIACKRYEMKYGHRPADIAALVPEFLPEVPLSPCDGKAVTLDLDADKIHIGGCKVEELRIGEPTNDAAEEALR